MSNSSRRRSLLKELEYTESVLQDLLATLSNLNSTLKPIEREMKVNDFATSGEFTQGISKGIVCVLTGLIQGDPLERVLTDKGRGRNIPALIKAGDRSESKLTIENVVNMLHAEDQKQRLKYVINMRWAELPAPLEKENVIVIGTRYASSSDLRISELERALLQTGFNVVQDYGEFGGGPLVYEVIKSFGDRTNLLVAELTLSREIVENDMAVIQVLNILASF